MESSDRMALGATVLRLSLGVMFIAHAYLKIFVFTLPGTVGFFEQVGFPGFLAYAVVALEAIGGVALLLGICVRWTSLALIPVLLGATSVHWGNGWVFSAEGGGWEYPLFLTVATAVQALLGAGAFAAQIPGGATADQKA